MYLDSLSVLVFFFLDYLLALEESVSSSHHDTLYIPDDGEGSEYVHYYSTRFDLLTEATL